RGVADRRRGVLRELARVHLRRRPAGGRVGAAGGGDLLAVRRSDIGVHDQPTVRNRAVGAGARPRTRTRARARPADRLADPDAAADGGRPVLRLGPVQGDQRRLVGRRGRAVRADPGHLHDRRRRLAGPHAAALELAGSAGARAVVRAARADLVRGRAPAADRVRARARPAPGGRRDHGSAHLLQPADGLLLPAVHPARVGPQARARAGCLGRGYLLAFFFAAFFFAAFFAVFLPTSPLFFAVFFAVLFALFLLTSPLFFALFLPTSPPCFAVFFALFLPTSPVFFALFFAFFLPSSPLSFALFFALFLPSSPRCFAVFLPAFLAASPVFFASFLPAFFLLGCSSAAGSIAAASCLAAPFFLAGFFLLVFFSRGTSVACSAPAGAAASQAANVAPCGSVKTAKRPIPGISVAGIITVPPAFSTLATV